MNPARGLMMALMLACWGCGDPPPPPPAPGETVFIDDLANYRFTSQLKASVQKIAEYGDSTIQWTGLRHDMHGHPIDPIADVHTVTLLLFPRLKPTEVLHHLANDLVEQSDIGLYMQCAPKNARCKLSEFGIFGSYPGIHKYFQKDRGSWLLMLSAKEQKGGLAFAFIEPDNQTSASEAVIQDQTSSFQMNVDLRSSNRVRVRADGDTKLDWSKITQDGLGNPVALYKIDQLTLARYGRHTLVDLEQRFIDVEEMADETYGLDVSGTDFTSLLQLKHLTTGDNFKGFSAPGEWLVALRCGTCNNPAPKVVAVLEVAEIP